MDKRLILGYPILIAIASVAISYGGSRPDDWPTWSIHVLTFGPVALIVLVLLDAIPERNRERWTALRTKFQARWSQLKTLRFRSPLLFEGEKAEETPPEKSTEKMLADYWKVAEYGNPIYKSLPALTSLDEDFLQNDMEELRPIVAEVGRSMRVLLSRLIEDLQKKQIEDPLFWIGWFVNVTFMGRAEKILARFDKQVEKGVDAREALAAFHFYYYDEAPKWVGRMLTFLNKPTSDYDEYWHWKIRNDQYVDSLKKKWESPQLRPLKEWIQIPRLNGVWDIA